MAVLPCARGVTIKGLACTSFGAMTQDQRIKHIYEVVVPFLEGKGVHLSEYGNCAGLGSLISTEKYEQDRDAHALFNIERVARVYSQILGLVESKATYKSGSYSLKHQIERGMSEYVANGDVILALLLHGFEARFGKSEEKAPVNCEFKVTFKAG